MKEKLLKIMTVVAFFAATFLPGCRKDTETFVEYQPTLGDIKSKVLAQVPTTDGVSVFTFLPGATDATFTTNSGIRLVFNDLQQLFEDAAGKTVQPDSCPDLKITVVEAVSRGEQVAHFLSATAAGQLLEPAGFIKIEVSCDGKSLKILPNRNFKIFVPAANQNAQKLGLGLFGAVMNGQAVVDWVSLNQEIYLSEWQSNGSTVYGYELLTTKTGWLAAAKTVPDVATNFCISLPKEHNIQNTVVFMWVPKTGSLIKMEGVGAAGQFCFAKAPVGFPVVLAVVSKIGDDWKYAQINTETSNDAQVSLSPVLSSEAEIVEKLRVF